MLLRDQAWLLLDAVVVICLAAPVPVPVPVAGCARQSEGGWSPALLCCLYRTRTRVNRGRIQPGRPGSGRRWNTHSRSLDLVGDRLAAFSIVLTGNQIADSERVSPACLNPSVRRRSAGSVLVARAARGRPVGIPNGGYLESSLSMPSLTWTSAALTCSWIAFTP